MKAIQKKINSKIKVMKKFTYRLQSENHLKKNLTNQKEMVNKFPKLMHHKI